MWGISYWIFPLFSAVVWLAMLLAMLLYWIANGSRRFPSMEPRQHIAYISDVGAQDLKPLFIAMGAVSVVSLDLAFIFERWLRHRGRLLHNTSNFQKFLSILSIIFSIAGAAGLILLAVFDTLRHPRLHDIFLIVFIGGYILSAIFICWEYQRLGHHFQNHPILKWSFYVKLAFIFIEVALAIAFGVTQRNKNFNTAAVLEWVIALIFTFYVFSFFMDFIPAVRTKHHQSRETEAEMAQREADSERMGPSSAYYGTTQQPSTDSRYGLTSGQQPNGYVAQPNGYTGGYTSEYGNGMHDGTYYPDGHAPQPVAPSRNF